MHRVRHASVTRRVARIDREGPTQRGTRMENIRNSNIIIISSSNSDNGTRSRWWTGTGSG